MACDLSTIQAAACESGIGKLDSKIKLLQAIAQLSCELSEAEPGNVDGLIWGPSPETVDSLNGQVDAVITFLNSLTGGTNYTTLSFGNPVDVTNDVNFSGSVALTSITFRLLETVGGSFDLNSGTLLGSVSAPLLLSVGTDVDLQNNAALTSVSLPSLASVGTDFNLSGASALTAISLPSLVSVGNELLFDNTGIINVTLPALTTVGAFINVSGGVVEALSLSSLSPYPPTGIIADVSLLTLNLPACVDDGAGQLNTDLATMTGLVTVNLASLTATTLDLDFSAQTSVASLTLTALVTVGGQFDVGGNPLSAISLPSLTTITGDTSIDNIAGLVSFSAPQWLPTNNTQILFSGDGLDATSVDHILARCVANPAFVSGTVDLSGGTNAPPGVQGAADVITLTGRGVVVVTN